jgi:hypothetical protein
VYFPVNASLDQHATKGNTSRTNQGLGWGIDDCQIKSHDTVLNNCSIATDEKNFPGISPTVTGLIGYLHDSQ